MKRLLMIMMSVTITAFPLYVSAYTLDELGKNKVLASTEEFTGDTKKHAKH